MKLQDIVAQLMTTLPSLTDTASDALAVANMTYDAGLVTVVTTAPHKLKTGQAVLVTGAESPVVIDTLTQALGIATGTTAQPHDLTEAWPLPVSIRGADQAAYNKTFTMASLTVPNRLTFSYAIDRATSTPATGSPLLLFDGKDRGYNGQVQVTVVNATTFTYPTSGSPYSPAQGTPVIHTNIRVGGALTIDRFMQLYSKQNEITDIWYVVTIDEVRASTSRYMDVDAVDVKTMGADFRQSLIEKFNLYVVIPAKDDLVAVDARDRVEDLKIPIFQSLIGQMFPTYLTEPAQYGVVLEGHGFYGYTGAYYIHEFSFQNLAKLTIGDAATLSLTTAFRDVILQLQDPQIVDIMTTDINLDDEPIT